MLGTNCAHLFLLQIRLTESEIYWEGEGNLGILVNVQKRNDRSSFLLHVATDSRSLIQSGKLHVVTDESRDPLIDAEKQSRRFFSAPLFMSAFVCLP